MSKECKAVDCKKEIDEYWQNKDFCDECFDNKVMTGKIDSKTGEYVDQQSS